MTCLPFKFFDRTVIERVLDISMSEGDVSWAERMWQRLEAAGLTSYSSPEQLNAVVIRFAVLARFLKLWFAYAGYGANNDITEEYEGWCEVLPIDWAVLPTTERGKTDILKEMLSEENDRVFEAIMRGYGEAPEIAFALDLRHAAGIGDDFREHARLDETVEMQEQFFMENSLSFREFNALSLITNRFH